MQAKRREAVARIVSFFAHQEYPPRVGSGSMSHTSHISPETGERSDLATRNALALRYDTNKAADVTPLLEQLSHLEGANHTVGRLTLGLALHRCAKHQKTTEFTAVLRRLQDSNLSVPPPLSQHVLRYLHRSVPQRALFAELFTPFALMDLPFTNKFLTNALAEVCAVETKRNDVPLIMLGTYSAAVPTRPQTIRALLHNETPGELRERIRTHRLGDSHQRALWQIYTSETVEEALGVFRGAKEEGRRSENERLASAVCDVCLRLGDAGVALDVLVEVGEAGGKEGRLRNRSTLFHVCEVGCVAKGDRFWTTAMEVLAAHKLFAVPISAGAAHSLLRMHLAQRDASGVDTIRATMSDARVSETPETKRILKDISTATGQHIELDIVRKRFFSRV